MTFSVLSPKQKIIFKWCYEENYRAIICDGAVRSGKTICMITSFILWAMKNFNGAIFGICGKTIRSAERNIILPLMDIADINAYFKLEYMRSRNLLTVENDKIKNNFFIFGGKDESSYVHIQGITFSGVFFDEVALMPRVFVEQAITRTLSVENAKLWFNCNPDSQFHWFYNEWIKRANERNALHLHFTMHDNPILSEQQIANAEKQFTGVFHDRYIKGLWVSAEGVIYKDFAENTERYLIDDAPKDIIQCNIGFDFGGNGSAHAGICTGFSKRLQKVIILDEYYRKEIISPSQLESDIIDFVRKCQRNYPVYDGYFDSAETTLIRGIKTACAKEKLNFNIHNAKKSEISERIAFTDLIMSQGRFFVLKSCKNIIEALQSAVWDKKYSSGKRLDDGNYNIDSIDAYEYSIEPLMNDIIEAGIQKGM